MDGGLAGPEGLDGLDGSEGPAVSEVDVVARASSTEPDLVVRAISAPPSAMPFAAIEVEIEVCNQGGDWVWGSDVAVVTSEDDIIDALDPVLTAAPFWEIAPGGCRRVTASGAAPGTPGRYVLGAIVDWQQYVYESDDSNNTLAGDTLAVGFDPDLVVERVRGPATAAPGAMFEIDVRVCNHGQAWIWGAGVELYLSPDAEITPADMLIGWVQTNDLAPGACGDFSAMASAWSGGPEGHVLGAIVDPYQYFVELDEDNNARAGSTLHIGWDPDLVVTAIKGPPSVMPGNPINVDVTVCNQGQSPSYYSSLQVLTSEDDTLDPMLDLPVGFAPLPYLSPAECIEVRVPGYTYGGPATAYRLGAVVDVWESVPELIEDNNATLGGFIGVGYGPDLVVTGVSGPPSSWPYEDVQATARVCNHGQAPSPSTNVRLYISEDGLSPPAQPYPGMAWVPWLEPGACADATGPAFAPGSPGGYVLGAEVDTDGWVVELIETNNAGAGRRIAVGHDADLVVTAVTPPPGALRQHGDAMVIARVCNHGRAPSDSALVELRISRDTELSGMDLPAGQGYLPWLQPDACADVPLQGHFHVSEEGGYFLLAVADPHGAVDEILDDNNTGASALVGIGQSADLVVTAIQAPPSAQPGASFELGVTVCNRGHMSSSYTEVEVLGRAEGVAAPIMDVFFGQAPVDYLPPGQCNTTRFPAQVSGPSGAYQLRATIDRWDYVSEILEVNNTFTGGMLGVGHDPDLVVAAVSSPPSALPGAPIDVTVRVCNQGQGWSWGVPVQVFFSRDDQLSMPGDLHAGWGHIDQLAPGDCADVAMSSYAHWEPGAWYLGAIVDPYQYVPELIESNNARAGERIGIGYQADLVVAQVSGPPSALPWTNIMVTARVCNQGQGPSYGAWVDALLSADADVGTGDLNIGGAPVPMLEPGACQDLDLPAHPQVYSGVYTLGAVVRADPGSELIADNNGRAGGLLGVGYEPDLVVTAVTGPASAPVYSEIVLTVEACNQGQGGSYETIVEVALSSDDIIDGSDFPLGSVLLAPLAPGQCQTQDVPVYPFQPEGSYVLGARVDPMGHLWELIETNNATAGASIELTPF